MSDSLVVADPTQALALATSEHETALATFSKADKRKAKWPGQQAPKKGKRWGLADDKPFKPLPYVELPVGLSETEVDQFLREQRLEDLQRKIQLCQLEDVEPDIRPPSPPPIFDKTGVRLNSREQRIRKAMVAEYHRLVRHMIKALEGYEPPLEYKPARLVKKIIIPYEKYPDAQFMGVIIGARGVNHKQLQDVSGCRISIRGKDVGDRQQTEEEKLMPQHVHIEGDTEEQINKAEELIKPLLDPKSPEHEYARTHGMQQVALVTGFALAKQDQRCGVCGALGHLGFECPETEALSYKMANVVCTICGDRGHVASDCKVAAEKRKQENVDWKVEAEKKAEMDMEYAKMMDELGIQSQPVFSPGAAPTEPRAAEAATRQGIRPPPGWKARPEAPAAAQAGAAAAARLTEAIRPGGCKARPAAPAAPAVAAAAEARAPARAGLGYTAPAPAPLRALMPPPGGGAGRTPAAPSRPKVVPGTVNLGAGLGAGLVPTTPKRPPAFHRPPVSARTPGPVAPGPLGPAPTFVRSAESGPGRATYVRPAPVAAAPAPSAPAGAAAGAAFDDSIACPLQLADLLRGDGGWTLREMSQDTGAQVTLSGMSAPSGGKRFFISGSPEALRRAKTHVRAWLDVHMQSAGLSPAGFPGFPPSAPAAAGGALAPPAGFPPGFPPGAALPSGFPPGMGPPPGMPPAGGLPPGLPPGFPPAPGPAPPGLPAGEGMPPGLPPGLPLGLPPGFPPMRGAPLVLAGGARPCGMSEEAFDEL